LDGSRIEYQLEQLGVPLSCSAALQYPLYLC